MFKDFRKQLIPLIIGMVLGLLLSIILQIAAESVADSSGKTTEIVIPSGNVSVIIDKSDLWLSLLNKGVEFKQYRISDGKNDGDKQKKGDCRTPVGQFRVISVENSSSWEYDFEDDDLGPIDGAYGPLFFRLKTPGWKGIGIHGTHDSSLIGYHNSHGCIRMKNEDLLDLAAFITVNTPVLIRE